MILAEINGFTQAQFVEAVGGVFNGSPWVAERAWRKRPFQSFDDLSTRLIQEVQSASTDEQLALLQQAPEPESADLEPLLRKYRKKFGFPFIYSEQGAATAVITEALNRRLKSAPEQEFQVALGHAFRIARSRLEETIH